jgi:uncharacterized protein (DUF1778 family)
MSSLTPAAGIPDPITRAINPGVREDIRDLIDQAAKSQGRSRSDFMIDTARRAAEEALLDQTLARVDRRTYDHFLAVLDQPSGGEGVARLMRAPRPWRP